MRRSGNSLVPSDGLSDNDMSEIPQGVTLKASITRPRSIPHHRLYFAVLKLVAENADDPSLQSVDNLHSIVKLKTGCVQIVRLPNGQIYQVPGSIKFHKMDQAEFNVFFDMAMSVIILDIMPGVVKDDLIQEAERMLK